MKVLVINSGSSSIKYQLFDLRDRSVLAAGVMERIGEPEARLTHHWHPAGGGPLQRVYTEPLSSRQQALSRIVAVMAETQALRDARELCGVGHRVVHGGEAFHEPTLIDDQVVEGIRAMIPLAPLHNPANLLGIEVSLELWPDVPQVAVFDTAFHQTMPPWAFHYALPQELYAQHQVRRYGFHGTSHQFVARQAAAYLEKPSQALNLITLHLGNGASAAAIRGGKSVDTSMGLTPLEGLIMGTRCGDLDPAIPLFLIRALGSTLQELEWLLNEGSGLKGICGANDMREVHRHAAAGDAQAELALEMFAYRIKKYIGAYLAVLGRVDALVFTGGIGENDSSMRERACDGLQGLGIRLDTQRNQPCTTGETREISEEGSPVKVLVIPTNEELEIAVQAVACIQRRSGSSCETERLGE